MTLQMGMKREFLGETLLSPYGGRKGGIPMKKILLTLMILSMAVLAGCAANRNEQKPSVDQTENGTQMQEDQSEKLTAEAAQLRALSHAQLKAEDVTGLRSDYDREENAFEVEFESGGWEYEYKIHAVSGAVLSSTQKRR